jgi:hypothetical protein
MSGDQRSMAGSGERGAASGHGHGRTPEEVARSAARRRLLGIVAAFVAAIAVVGAGLLIRWKAVGPRAFVLRDLVTNAVVAGPPFTVVVDARRKPGDPFPSHATLVKPDMFGRYEPAPETGGEVSEFYVWHIAYKPVVHGQPSAGVIVLEPHRGAPSPELEAELRGLGEVVPEVGAALKAAFLSPGPASRMFAQVARAAPRPPSPGATGASAPKPGDAATPAPATAPDAASSASAAAMALPAEFEDAGAKAAADATAAAMAVCREHAGATKSPEYKAALAQLESYVAAAPKDRRLTGSRALKQAVDDALGDEPQYGFTRRVVELAGALYQGSSLMPAPLVGYVETIEMWPAEGRLEYAVACARIGGGEAGRAIARLVASAKLAPAAAWVATAQRTGSRAAIERALAEAAAALDPKSPEAARLAKASAAVTAPAPEAPAVATPRAPQ